MLSRSVIALLAATQSVSAFPFVANEAGVDSSLLRADHIKRQQPNPDKCAFNPNHPGAAPITDEFPYNGAKGGLPGKGKGGFLVPDPKDKAHQFTAPDYSVDIRGPCPGLNAMANHNFLSHDGIVTFSELVDAQQNVYNVGYDLAVLLAVLGLTTTDGDIVTEKLSLGCDATGRTSIAPLLTGSEPGLNGHNKFEADSSLTRNDYFLANGDNFHTNGTLFGMMDKTSNSVFNFDAMAKYRYQRYQQSRAENSHFYFGPFSLLLYGASSFLYELMPSGTRNYVPDLYTISSFFGTEKVNGNWVFNGKERIPDNWTNRLDPYTVPKVGAEIFKQYAAFPVEFGGATANGSYAVVSGPNGLLASGKLSDAVDPSTMSCFLYMLATERIPSSLNGVVTPTVDTLSFALKKLSPQFENLGCPFPLS